MNEYFSDADPRIRVCVSGVALRCQQGVCITRLKQYPSVDSTSRQLAAAVSAAEQSACLPIVVIRLTGSRGVSRATDSLTLQRSRLVFS